MYVYDADDFDAVQARADQFRGQVARRLAGEITENEFKPLRLQNGLYMQLHSYMLRVAIPYGLLSSAQMRCLAHIARTYDRDYGHFTTRQNIQYNWPDLEDVPKILDDLAAVGMHAIQTSGNCIRNTTSDPFAGVARDEYVDPRPYCELIRQWSTFHPEFAALPRKFKIAVTGAKVDRAAIAFHDIGLKVRTDEANQVYFEVWVGGGQGRTPVVAKCIHDRVGEHDLLSYLEAIMRVYNRHGRRDNKYKARIKILVDSMGPEAFKQAVEDEWAHIRTEGIDADAADLAAMRARFRPVDYPVVEDIAQPFSAERLLDAEFDRWMRHNTFEHRVEGHTIAVISLKMHGLPAGDATADQMDTIADLAAEFSHDEVVVTHRQNLVLPHVKTADLFRLWRTLRAHGLGNGNFDRADDTIACPGLDYCNLANARSIDVAQWIGDVVTEFDRAHALGPVHVNVSGCINACGHHHVGHIGVLGINKRGQEFYQVTLGGSNSDDAAIGKVVGRAFARDEIVPAIGAILTTFIQHRDTDEVFLETVRRIGLEPFKEAIYGPDQASAIGRRSLAGGSDDITAR
ncbi:MAG: nitrite/sulfite reductase [Myxococcota bacterium]|nr:nitrite/sulfite reductase [Myxococcota bacterium]